MKKRIGSLLLAFALPLTSCCTVCFGESGESYEYYERGSISHAKKIASERKISKLETQVEQLQNEKKIKELENQIKQLKQTKEKSKKSSVWSSIKRTFKEIFSTGVGIFSAVGALSAILAGCAGLWTTGVAAYDCYKDDKCHFKDESFLSKFKLETFTNSLKEIVKVALEYVKNIHYVSVHESKDEDNG